MKNELMIKNDKLIKAIEDTSINEMFKPLTNEIHLFDTFIANTIKIKNQNLLKALQVDEKLILQRENSKFDDNEIVVLNANKEKLGYIPEKDNLIFSRLMDAGKLLIAKVTSIDTKERFYKITIGIYLIDY